MKLHFILNPLPFTKFLRECTLSMWEESQSVLQIFQRKCRSPGDHRPKYFMAQQFFQKRFPGPSHQF